MFKSVFCTDTGVKKEVNQDSLIIRKADTDEGEILMSFICDGMGGLSDGELASKEAVLMLDDFFDNDLPDLLKDGLSNQGLTNIINAKIHLLDRKIRKYGEDYGACGTTMSGILLFNGKYMVLNIGDSRVYRINEDKIEQLTHDQSVVQDLIDKGEISEIEAETHPQRSVLLQCVGTGDDVVADIKFGNYDSGDFFLICSDGFRHKISSSDMFKLFSPANVNDKKDAQERLEYAVDLNIKRYEKDNITAILIMS